MGKMVNILTARSIELFQIDGTAIKVKPLTVADAEVWLEALRELRTKNEKEFNAGIRPLITSYDPEILKPEIVEALPADLVIDVTDRLEELNSPFLVRKKRSEAEGLAMMTKLPPSTVEAIVSGQIKTPSA